MSTETLRSTTAARDRLFDEYADVLTKNADLDRSLVSFQANKTEPFYRWFKYKEGFSSNLIRYLLTTLSGKKGTLLDPFAGTGAALFASQELGWSAVGLELLPVGFFAMTARESAHHVQPKTLLKELERLQSISLTDHYDPEYVFRHLRITEGAFPEATERQMASLLAYCDNQVTDRHVRKLIQFACFSILEEISYTRKDGQYLRWDSRSCRQRGGKLFDKGRIMPFREALLRKLKRMAEDIAGTIFGDSRKGVLDMRQGSCFEILPDMAARSIDFVITSPPYCNRYDYTRTYALELAFLGYTDKEVGELRQRMLSCTVENKEKIEELRALYDSKGQASRFRLVEEVFSGQEALFEVLNILEGHKEAGDLNNSNIPRMVRNYFYEMCFVVLELARLLKPGGKMVLVNDNVRYAGEEVPVDLILSDFARSFGLNVRHIWVLPRGKGNSSQQMGLHGRQELRKCVYVWEKPTLPVRGSASDK